jgi:cold shock CspA family protein
MERLTGRVKWFNLQNGFGFITPTIPIGNSDIFVHHTSLVVSRDQYKYLVEGEYVEFTLEEVNTRDHSFHAVDITGINKGMLMC